MTQHSLDPSLEMAGVCKSYPDGVAERLLLQDVDLIVDRGEIVSLMGPSGSGKSTLLAIAGGLEEPDQGVVCVAGRNVSGSNAEIRAEVRRQNVGFVFQDFNLLSALSAIDNVALALELDGCSRRVSLLKAEETLEALGLESVKARMPGSLSGGERQRVAIARATVGKKTLILADEPTGSLDEQSSWDVLELLRDVASLGAGVLLVTHSPGVAAETDRTEILSGSSLRSGGPLTRHADQ